MNITFIAPSTAPTLEIGIFDGDSAGLWDLQANPPESLEYTLFADPVGDGSGTAMVGQWLGDGPNPTSGSGPGGSWSADSATMPDNGWWNLTVNTSPAAQGSNGNYIYYLTVRVLEETPPQEEEIDEWSNFKLRVLSPGTISVSAPNNVLAFSVPLFGEAELNIIYPNWRYDPDGNIDPASLTPTTYDGTWDFYFYATAPQSSVSIWDGDFDYGSFNCADNDTDDPDTPNAPFLPPWAVGTAAVAEGVAVGAPGLYGCPATSDPWDEDSIPGDEIWRRPPSGQYELIDPNGIHYLNDNPSGNLEWEQFRVDTAPFVRSQMDHHANSLPAGMYTVHITGLDLANLGALHFVDPALGEQCSNGKCGPPPPPPPPPVGHGGGTGTLGYWKNHPTMWPVTNITIGGVTYTEAQAIAILQTAPKGDMSYILAHQLIAAKLNVKMGNDASCVDGAIHDADSWMVLHPVGSGVKSGAAAVTGNSLSQTLDNYNNGKLCAPHRDESDNQPKGGERTPVDQKLKAGKLP